MSDQNPSGMSLPELVAFCRANGVTRVTYNGMVLELGAAPPPAVPDDAARKDALQKFSEAMAGDVPSDEEFLGWSAGGDFVADLAAIRKQIFGEGE